MSVALTTRSAVLLGSRACFNGLVLILLLFVWYLPDSLYNDHVDDGYPTYAIHQMKVGLFTASWDHYTAVFTTEQAFEYMRIDVHFARGIQACTQLALFSTFASLLLFTLAVFAGNHAGLRCCTACLDVLSGVFALTAAILNFSHTMKYYVGPGFPLLLVASLFSCCTPLCACFVEPTCIDFVRGTDNGTQKEAAGTNMNAVLIQNDGLGELESAS
ncbi:hypothetical protein DIPPA_31530 [Diplonema papillatum]|nr:hypothetical protein DIPPA_31530 [Diplonema papillatum]